MESASSAVAEKMTVTHLDRLFLDIVLQLNAGIVEGTSQSVRRILDLSMNFLSEKGQNALQEFYNLYFSTSSMEQQKSDVNREVDDIFDAIQAELTSGGDLNSIDASQVQEDEEKRNSRLAIAAVQKQLESLITLEAGLREKLVPAMMSMQFEDLVRQRMQRIDTMWRTVFSYLANSPKGTLSNLKEQGRDIFASTFDEKELYLPIVLNQKPETKQEVTQEDDGIWFKAS